MGDKPILTEDEWSLWHKQHGQKLDEAMLAEFRSAAQRHQLNPLARQICAVVRNSSETVNGDKVWTKKMTVQCTIDGYRLIADRTGKYAGSDDGVMLYGTHERLPVSACVAVYKMVEGQRCAFSATARWEEYYPGDKQGQMWQKMPNVMLAKCAEALALRKGFPAELSGLYTDAEMQQADAVSPPPPAPQEPAAPTATRADKQRVLKAVQDYLHKNGTSPDGAATLIQKVARQEIQKETIGTQGELAQVEQAITDGKYTLDSGEPVPDAA